MGSATDVAKRRRANTQGNAWRSGGGRQKLEGWRRAVQQYGHDHQRVLRPLVVLAQKILNVPVGDIWARRAATANSDAAEARLSRLFSSTNDPNRQALPSTSPHLLNLTTMICWLRTHLPTSDITFHGPWSRESTFEMSFFHDLPPHQKSTPPRCRISEIADSSRTPPPRRI